MTLQGEVAGTAGGRVYSIGDVATFREKRFSGGEAGEYRDAMLPGEHEVGHITCSARGHSVGATLAMAYVEVAHSWPGNNLIVLLSGRPVPARVTPTPFFDPQHARLRARPRDDEEQAEPSTSV